MFRKIQRLPWLILLALAPLLLAVSCAFQTPSVSVRTSPESRLAILYGRFDISNNFVMGNSLGLWLQNLDTQKPVYIFFAPYQPFKALLVPPGNYQVTGFVGINRSHKIEGRWAFHHAGQISPVFTAQAGVPTYLGDFLGTIAYDGEVANWGIKHWQNHFDDTSMDFRQKFPQLRLLPVNSIFPIRNRHPSVL
jgi:hypothetical protein